MISLDLKIIQMIYSSVIYRQKLTLHINFLLQLLTQLGLPISEAKLVPPSTSVVCLGILINTLDRTFSIPPDKLSDINATCKKWETKGKCTKKESQSLLGLLLYVTKCVKPAVFF